MKRSDMERRKQQRLAKLGTNTPICGECGEHHWACLELHHVADHGRDEATVIICANCHKRASDAQKDHPAFDQAADPTLDRIGHFLLGLADLLSRIVEKLIEFAHILIELAKPDTLKGEAQ